MVLGWKETQGERMIRDKWTSTVSYTHFFLTNCNSDPAIRSNFHCFFTMFKPLNLRSHGRGKTVQVTYAIKR
ncbi:hypothetical protein VNO78_19901 [Psophocarpus tetragonolobus]|uniref:Uncharacterized protein n=1 Tax=Psophocarpus tetragonolobus TaxID=3891 RepID=A0AAN9S9F1_PSOTE